MTILVFGHCLLLKKEAGTTNVLASPLGQGERIKVRSLERPALLAPRENPPPLPARARRPTFRIPLANQREVTIAQYP